MTLARQIVIGVDVSLEAVELAPGTRSAIDQGLAIAASQRASATLVTVLDPALAGDAAEANDNLRRVQALHEAEIAAARSRGVQLQSVILEGRSWLALIEEVFRQQANLLVVGAREHSTARRMFFGSTALKLLRKCPCPLWVTRPGSFAGETRLVIAADDLAPVGERVLSLGVEAARVMDARLLVVHAVMYPLEGGMKRNEAPVEMVEEYRQKVRSDAERSIQERVAQLDVRSLSAGVKIAIESGRPESVIEAAVREQQADLLVMGTLGRGGIAGFLIGNTAERLLSEIECSVLAVKPSDFVSPVAAPSA